MPINKTGGLKWDRATQNTTCKKFAGYQAATGEYFLFAGSKKQTDGIFFELNTDSVFREALSQKLCM